MNYMSTSFQSNESSAPVYDLATDHDNQLKPSQGPHNGPKGSMYSELGEYARLSHSAPSTEKLLRPQYRSSVESDQHSPYGSSQLYDTADVSFNQPTDNNGRGQDTYTVKPQQSVQYTAGKGLQVVTIVLLALILMLLVCVLVLLLLNKGSCACDTSSNSAGLTNSGNTAINCNLSLIQKNVEDIKENCATTNSSLLLQSNVEYIMEQINDHNVKSNLSLIQDTMNQNSLFLQNTMDNNSSVLQNKINDLMEWCATKNSSLLLQSNLEYIMEQINEHNVNSNLSLIQNTMNQYSVFLNAVDNISLVLQNKIDYLMRQVNDHNVNSNLSLIQDTMNGIIQQIMVHANNTNRSTDELLQLLNTSLIKDISIPTAAAVNDVLLIVNELLEIQTRSSLLNIRLVSCKDIKTAYPNSPSGYYHVNSHNIYCNMGELCGQDKGWTRIAYLDISQHCPSGLQELMTGGIRVCRREGDSNGCRSNVFQTNGISYSQVCGKVVGYQKGRTDGVTNINNINNAYIDGVSITRGSPRQHVWSYIAGHQSNINAAYTCPCNDGATSTVPSFVGEHYYCESGTDSGPSKSQVYTTDPLWDGNNCLSYETPCCTGTGLPWFFRDYGNATITDYIELRVCGTAGWSDEDTPVQLYEIYVK